MENQVDFSDQGMKAEELKQSILEAISPIHSFFKMMDNEQMPAGEVGLALYKQTTETIIETFDILHKHLGEVMLYRAAFTNEKRGWFYKDIVAARIEKEATA